MTVLEVRDLKTYYYLSMNRKVKAIDGVTFDVNEGEVLGLAGESGCGKTTIALSIMKLVPIPGRIQGGNIFLQGENIINKSEKQMQKIRWKKISIIFQGSMNALNPVLKTGEQIAEAIMAHEKVSKSKAMKRVEELLEMVRIDQSKIESYPHELSGGMKQRVMIAMAMSCNPSLIIADEPVTALDVIVQAQILRLLQGLQRKFKQSMILITHDLSVIAQTCHRCMIMYAGKIVEYADTKDIFKNPMHPYTQALIKSYPHIRKTKTELMYLPGSPPNLLSPEFGCRFHPRCRFATETCRQVEPALLEVKRKHYAACHKVK